MPPERHRLNRQSAIVVSSMPTKASRCGGKLLSRASALLLCATLVIVAHATEYHGRVLFGTVPLPGATVTATRDTQTFSTVTDAQGLFEFPELTDGVWELSVDLHGFIKVDREVTIGANAQQLDIPLKLMSLDQLLNDSMPDATPVRTEPLNARSAAPPATRAPASPPTQSTAEISSGSEAADAESSSDGLLINGSVNNAATSSFSLSPAFGNHRANARNLYNGSFVAIADNSALDARPYSLTGLSIPKAEYSRITTGVTFGGPLRLPPLLYHGPNFFLGYQWTRNSDASTAQGLVPTDAQRTEAMNTGADPTALSLLQYYPAAQTEITGNGPYNFERQVLSATHQDLLRTHLDKSVGRRDQYYGNFGLTSIRANATSLFGFTDTTNTLGMDGDVNWQHRYARQLFVLLSYHISRLRTELRPEFANKINVSGLAGIAAGNGLNGGNSQAPRDWGPPTLLFSGGISSLTDGIAEFNRNRTDATSVKIITPRGHHTITAGGDFRRQEYNELQQSNPRGTYTFTGAATSGSTSSTNGADFDDFLAGTPDTSAIAYGNADKYFRQNVYDAYATDDWRVWPELTISAGLRWEYGAPLSELKGRIVNLDLTPSFSAETPVLGSSPKGTTTGQAYPASLIRPDRRGFEPRIALSWRPIPASSLVVRGGYGIYDDTSIYLGAAQSMSQQAPLSTSVTVSNSPICPLTLAHGFFDCTGTTADTFAVDPNLKVGYAQVWQISAQQDLPGSLVVTTTYQGTKGTHGMQQFLPNTYPIGATPPCPLCPVGFLYRTSGGNSEREAGQVQIRRRLRSGLAATALYTFAKAVDDDSQLGGQGHTVAEAASSASSTSATTLGAPVIAQNWLDLRAERSRSSFDQRHLLTASLQYTTGLGKGGGTLLSGWRGRVVKEWTISTQLSIGSGLPETPIYFAAVPGTGITGSIRPDRTTAPLYRRISGSFLNVAAFAAPLSGQWGNAGRNSINGPGTFSLDGALERTFRFKDPYSFDVGVNATNYLNHVVFTSYDTTINSTFGAPVGAYPTRSLQLTGRFRF